MARETGKQRSQRIQIDYYRRRGGLNQLKSACVIAGLLGGGLYAAYVLAAGDGSQTSTGPLASVHASFENDCRQCHQNFTPMDSRGAKLDWKLVGLNPTKSIGHIEAACQTCHRVGDHYRDTMNADWQLADQNCASCHADHQGRNHDLASVAMDSCTNCHSNLSAGCVGAPKVRPNVVAFDMQQHGDFASLSKGDPGTVKFDHQQHMLDGQVNVGEKGAFTIEMLEPSLRERYRKTGQSDSDAVRLDCSSCHELAGNPDGKQTLIADGELGRYIKPISFEKHCSACHSMNPEIATEDTTPLPHAVPWNKIDLLLQATISGARASGQARTPRDDSQSTPQPGEGLGKPAPLPSRASAVDIDAARKLVANKCLQCHDARTITNEAIAAAISGAAEPMIPSRWLVHGLYDHAAHRRIDCRYCHRGAYPTDGAAKSPTDHETVMIAGIESCAGCHRDAETPTPTTLSSPDVLALLGGQPTWASENCTLCHRYHTPVSLAGSPQPTAANAEGTP